MLDKLRALKVRFPKLFPIAAIALLGSVGAVAAHAARADSCCYPGSPCCYPGSPCCAAHHKADAAKPTL